MDEFWYDYSSGWESELDDELEKLHEYESSQERSDWANVQTNTLTLYTSFSLF